MKRFFAFSPLVVLLVLFVSSCGGGAESELSPPAPPASQELPATSEPATEVLEALEPAEVPPTETPTDVPTEIPPTEVPTETPAEIPPAETPTEVPPTETPVREAPVVMEVSTSAFEPNGKIPVKFSCLGENVSPALAWSGIPAEARSLLLLVYDLDAGAESGASTSQGFSHWIVYNIPPAGTGYPEDMPAGDSLNDGSLQGRNDFAQFESEGATFPGGAPVKLVGYDGPCPGGEHRYVFALYALDIVLDLQPGAMMAQVLEAMAGHVLTQAEVVGAFAP